MNKWIKIVFYGMVIVFLMVIFAFISKEKANHICTGFSIHFEQEQNTYFLTQRQVKTQLAKQGFANLLGKPLNAIDLKELEKNVNKNPYVLNAEVYSNLSGEINLKIRQRKPVFRLINQLGQHFYIDELACKMPISKHYTPHVLVANGFIDETYKQGDSLQNSLTKDIFQIVNHIQKNDFLKALMVQIYVNKKQEIELITRLGNHSILFGDASDLEAKFERLVLFYKSNCKLAEFNEYKSINVQYKGQIICKK